MIVVTTSGSRRLRDEPYRRRNNNNNNNDWMRDFQYVGEEMHVNDEDNDLMAEEAIEGEEGDDDVALYKPLLLPSRTYEQAELNESQKRSECFGCVYIGEKNAAAIPYEDIMNIINIARQSMARTDLSTMAIYMAEKYEKLRNEINSSLMPGEDPLPEWKASTILEHIRHHNQDPDVQQLVCIAETQELREHLLNACLEKDEITGNVRGNKDQIACYEKITKLQFQLQKMDATKMAFYSGGAHVDTNVAKQGAFAMSQKNLRSYWSSVRQ